MSPWQLESAQDGPRNLPLKFGQNRVSNSWDIADIEFVWGGWGGVEFTVIFMSNLQLQLRLFCSWVWVLTKILAQKRCQYNKMFDQKKNVYKKFCSSKILVTKKILIQKYFAHKNVAHKKIAPKNFVQKSSAQKRWPKKCCPKSFINIKSVTAEIFLMEKCRQKSLGLKNCCVQNFFSETNFWANKSRL